jgi:hypothetical protein
MLASEQCDQQRFDNFGFPEQDLFNVLGQPLSDCVGRFRHTPTQVKSKMSFTPNRSANGGAADLDLF